MNKYFHKETKTVLFYSPYDVLQGYPHESALPYFMKSYRASKNDKDYKNQCKEILAKCEPVFPPDSKLKKYGLTKHGGYFCETISTGGYSGGNCWDDSPAQPYYEASAKLAYQDIDDFLRKHAPTMSFLDYKELLQLIHEDTYTEHEYYGNSTNYSYYILTLKEMVDFLESKGYLK